MVIKRKKTRISKRLQDSARGIVDKNKPILGIDIGSSTIKIIQMKKDHNPDKWAMELLPRGMINQGKIEAKEPLIDIIKNTLKTNKIKTKACALYLSASDLIVRELTFPKMEDIHIRENIKQEISSMLPQDHDDYYIDYKIIEYIKDKDEEEGRFRVLATAAPKRLIHDYVKVLKEAGLKVQYIDVLPNIAGKLCQIHDKENKNEEVKNLCIIDFGAKKIEIVILQEGNYSLHKTINYGGEYLTTVIANETGMDEIDGEYYKCKTNFFNGKESDSVVKGVYNYFDYLISDFQRTIEFYNNRSSQQIDRIYIMGGASLLKGLPEYLESQLSIEVKKIDEIFTDFKKVSELGRHISIFPQAIGATFREEWKYER